MLPSFGRLALRPAVAVTGNGMDDDSDDMDDDMMPEPPPDLSDLPPELWEKILEAMKTPEPCDEVVKLCALNQKWASMCRSGELYDMANRALGWYGKQGTWLAVLALYAALKQDPPGDGTPKAYFQFACNTHFDKFNRHIAPWHPFYEAKLLSAARYNNPPILDMATVPWYVSNYDRVARLLISKDYTQLQSVNPEHPGLKKLALDTFDYWGRWNDHAPGEPHHGLRTTHVWYEGFREHPLFQEVFTTVVRKHGWEALDGWEETMNDISKEFYERLKEIAGPRPEWSRVPTSMGGPRYNWATHQWETQG